MDAIKKLCLRSVQRQHSGMLGKAARNTVTPMLFCLLGMVLYVPVTYSAVVATCLTDTTQSDFLAGVSTNVDLNTSPGDATLMIEAGIDQQNTAGTSTGTSFGTAAWGGQTFIPRVTGRLTKTEVQLFCSGCGATPPDLTLSVRATSAGLPTGVDLSSTTIPGLAFASGDATSVTATFNAPAMLTSGTQYALILRPVSAPAGSGYFWTRSSPSTYSSGSRVFSGGSGTSWSVDTTRDFNFKTYMNQGYTSGNLVSIHKDAGPATDWDALSWTSMVPANTSLRFQAAAANDTAGPFDFVGPNGTATTFFETSGASLSQFNGFRYLKYKAYLATTDNAVTPTLNDATVCILPMADLSITKSDGVLNAIAGGALTYTITASNAGPRDAEGATVSDFFPASLTATWTCVGAGGGVCTASGSGNISDTVNLPVGGSVTYTASATLSVAARGSLSNTATVTPPANVTDPTPGNNSATDTDTIIALAYTVGGNVSGLATGKSVVLQNNGGDNLTVPANGVFTFPNQVTNGNAYAVTVLAQPAGQTCTVSQGSGTMGASNVNDVAVSCVTGLAITTTGFGSLHAGQALSGMQLSASGGSGSYTWSAADPAQPLPAGLSLSASGLLTGTPTAEGHYSTLVSVTDGGGTSNQMAITTKAASNVSQVFTGTVAAATPVPSLGAWGVVLLNLMAASLGALGLLWRRRHARA